MQINAKNLERVGMLGLLAIAVSWQEVERRRMLVEVKEARQETREVRAEKDRLQGDFQQYAETMAKTLAGAVGR